MADKIEKIVTLCKENDETTEYYPNIKGDNIPDKSISKDKLSDEINSELDAKATKTELETLENTVTSNKTELETKIDLKANQSTTYTKAETDDLLDAKANSSDVFTQAEINILLQNGYYNQTEIDLMLENKADVDDVYTKTATDTLLDVKLDKSKVGIITISSSSGTLTSSQYDEIIKDIAIIKYGNITLYKQDLENVTTESSIIFKSNVKSKVINGTYTQISQDVITINSSTKAYQYTENAIINTYTNAQIDNLIDTKINDIYYFNIDTDYYQLFEVSNIIDFTDNIISCDNFFLAFSNEINNFIYNPILYLVLEFVIDENQEGYIAGKSGVIIALDARQSVSSYYILGYYGNLSRLEHFFIDGVLKYNGALESNDFRIVLPSELAAAYEDGNDEWAFMFIRTFAHIPSTLKSPTDYINEITSPFSENILEFEYDNL